MVQPLNDQVALIIEQEEDSLFLGLADSQKYATVVAVGPGYLSNSGERVPLTVAVGDTVLLPRGDFIKHKIGAKEYIFLRENELLAIVTKDEI